MTLLAAWTGGLLIGLGARGIWKWLAPPLRCPCCRK